MPDQPDALERELVELGRALAPTPPRDDLVAAVLARIESSSGDAPRGRVAAEGEGGRRRRTRRLAWAIAALVVLVVGLVPPVRAAVLELLRIGGVVIREEAPPHSETPSVTPPASSSGATPGSRGLTLAEARAAVDFPVAVPALLGRPDHVAVLREGRVVELAWGSGDAARRLDVFEGSPSWGYLKRIWTDITATSVGASEAVWIGAPHLIEWIDRSGLTHAEPPRLAGPTLVWVVPGPAGEVTYRLEGPVTLDAALSIARSAR